jgi:hypothetical protein
VNGSPLKWLSIVDEYTRECLTLKVDRSITSEDAIDTLAELFAMRGVPKHIRSDNGPEFIAMAIRRWADQLGIETLYIEPGSPWQNGYAESFHGKLRDEFLALEEFESLAAARKLTTAWKDDYNQHRPHSSLGYVAPAEFADRCRSCRVGWRWNRSNTNLRIGSLPGGRSKRWQTARFLLQKKGRTGRQDQARQGHQDHGAHRWPWLALGALIANATPHEVTLIEPLLAERVLRRLPE